MLMSQRQQLCVGVPRVWGRILEGQWGFQSCSWKILKVFREEELSMAQAEGGAELEGVWTMVKAERWFTNSSRSSCRRCKMSINNSQLRRD